MIVICIFIQHRQEDSHQGRQQGYSLILIHPWEARGLSPREAARIQTFPDDFILKGAQNSWYAQVGNAVPVKFAEVIGRSIMKFL